MLGVPCRHCGANLDSHGESCGRPGSIEERTPTQTPIAAKRAAVAAEENDHYKGGKANESK